MVYDPAAHEALTDAEWDPARAEAGIAAIVADAEAARADGAWPNHPRDDDGDLQDGTSTLYLGAAGLIWALRRLGSRLDFGALADEAPRRSRERPDFGELLPGVCSGSPGSCSSACSWEQRALTRNVCARSSSRTNGTPHRS